MVKLTIGLSDSIDKLLQLLKMKVNPYLVLGISKDALPVQTKSIFRKRMFDARNNDELRAKICIAYDILVNKNYYNIFLIRLDARIEKTWRVPNFQFFWNRAATKHFFERCPFY